MNSEVMETSEYLKNYPVPWSPWHYAYRRSLLLEHNIKFVECVRWEDLDYVMKSLLSIDYIKRIPLTVYKYVLTGENTSIMGKDMVRIEDWMKMSVRLSHFSRVRLCVTPKTSAHEAPPSLGFSRQEHWSGLPFPSPM